MQCIAIGENKGENHLAVKISKNNSVRKIWSGSVSHRPVRKIDTPAGHRFMLPKINSWTLVLLAAQPMEVRVRADVVFFMCLTLGLPPPFLLF